MLAPDVNILIYAHREDDPSHEFYRNWLEDLVKSREPFALSVLVAAAFVRIVTHEKFPNGATPLIQAWAVVDELVAQPNCRVVAPMERHLELVRKLTHATHAAGPEIGDAQHAAVAMEHAATWVTRDRDFEPWVSQGLRLQILEPM